jgi:hypothetical protein
MCDYSLHALATRPAKVGETLISTAVAVCMLPGTELAFEQNVKYDNRWIWTRTSGFSVGKFNTIDPHLRERHHDAIEFPDGSYVLVTQLCTGQRATVLQLPMVHPVVERTAKEAGTAPAAQLSAG